MYRRAVLRETTQRLTFCTDCGGAVGVTTPFFFKIHESRVIKQIKWKDFYLKRYF